MFVGGLKLKFYTFNFKLDVYVSHILFYYLFLINLLILYLFSRPSLLREQHYPYLKRGLRHLSDAYEVRFASSPVIHFALKDCIVVYISVF